MKWSNDLRRQSFNGAVPGSTLTMLIIPPSRAEEDNVDGANFISAHSMATLDLLGKSQSLDICLTTH